MTTSGVGRTAVLATIVTFVAGWVLAAAPTNSTPAPAAPTVPVAPLNPAGDGTVTDVGVKSSGRHGEYTKKVMTAPHMKVVAGSFFGTEAYEEFVDVGGLADGTIVAFGNTWGPQCVKTPSPTILGKGQHSGKPGATKDKKGNDVLDYTNPDCSGMIVAYAEDLGSIGKIVKMDWGVGNIRSGIVSEDAKGLIVAGQCHAGFKSFSSGCSKVNLLPYQAPPADATKKPVDRSALCDVYVARFDAASLKVEWVWVLEKNGDVPESLFSDKAGNVYFDAGGMQRISSDGKSIKVINSKGSSGTAKWLGVDPNDGGVFFGGDRNTRTGHEPYRQPYLYKFDADGKKVVTLWEPNPREIGSGPEDGHLESDSSPRSMAWSKTEELLVSGWSDGGNSVFPRQALDWHKPATGGGMGIQTWGMQGASSLGHLMRIDPKTWETKSHTWWAAFIPGWFTAPRNRGAPNGLSIDQICVLGDGSVAIAGGSATGLIHTPNGFWLDPMTGNKYGGAYVSVFLPDLSNLIFSSYVPGCSPLAIGATRKGVAIVSRSAGDDKNLTRPTSSPIKKAIQKQFGGATDAHIVVLELPGAGRDK